MVRRLDILPDFTPRTLDFGRIPVYSSRGSLKDELSKGRITERKAIGFLRNMLRIREFESAIADMRSGAFKPREDFEFVGATHLSVGQEAVAVGSMAAIRPVDYITSTHRGHGHCIAKGMYSIEGMDRKRLLEFDLVLAKQREAMNFLKEHIFSSGAFKFPPELMRKLEAERHYTYGDDAWERERDDYPLHAMVNNIQSRALSRMYDPLVLQRMLDLPLLYEKGEEPFTMAEMFQQTRYAIWEEVYEQVNVDSMRRNLQRTHLNIICGIALGYGGVPPDAASLAHADLVALRGQIAAALRKGGQDAMTQAHLEECLTRIVATLDASIQRGL